MRNLGLTLMMAIAILIVAGCKKDDSKKNEEGSFYFDAAKKTLPVITPSTTKSANPQVKSALGSEPWASGNPMYLLYSILRDYNNETDEGSVGIENLYKLLYQTNSFFDDALNHGQSITEQIIDSPFSFDEEEVTYNIALNDSAYNNGFAVKQVNGVNYSLFGWYRKEGANTERAVMRGSFNKITRALKLDLVSYLEKEAKDGMRVHIEGNDSTHLFTLKFMKYTVGGYTVSAVGHGISRGAGNYFLFKLSDWENNVQDIAGKYYCFPATATEDTLKKMNARGSDIVIPACSAYKATVDALRFFTMDDLPQSPADFNTGGGTGKAAEGTVFLDFE